MLGNRTGTNLGTKLDGNRKYNWKLTKEKEKGKGKKKKTKDVIIDKPLIANLTLFQGPEIKACVLNNLTFFETISPG